jgi:hypothetical protein
VEGNTIKLWYGGFDQVHGTALKLTTGSIGLATLRKDGFASLDAGATAGTILTKPLTNAGGVLQVNYRAGGGSLKVEVLDEDNNVLPGYGQADCIALTGDSVSETVAWGTNTALPAAASSLSLRFILQNASLYSFMAGQSASLVDVPIITQHPANQVVSPGGSASFAVVASAINSLSYQWQKNQINLVNGGHYSGCATPTLTITEADSADAALYRCVVTNAYGSAISTAATLVVASNDFGTVTLAAIPTLSTDTSNEARALTPDGRYVVGLSGTGKGFLYDSVSTTVVQPVSSDGAAAQIVIGAGYRSDTSQSPAQQQLIVSGLSSGYQTAWMTTNSGATWGAKVRTSTSGLKRPTVPLANGLAATASNVFYAIWTDEGTGPTDNWGMRVGKYSGAWPATPAWQQKDAAKPDICQANGVSSNGRAVGWRRSGTTGLYVNYVVDWTTTNDPAVWSFPGLDGTPAGQAYAVGTDGTIVFGSSPVVVGGVTNSYGYKALFNAAYPGPAAQLSINPLPNLPGAAGSASLAIPHGCTPNGKYAVGVCSRAGIERAVLWDTSAPEPAEWTVTDLSDVAAASGASGIFTRLARAYSIGTDTTGSLVIAGLGFDTNSPARTRAFRLTLAPGTPPVVTQPTVTISGSYAAGFTFSFVSAASQSVMYILEYTTSLTPPCGWTPIAASPGTGAVAILSDPNPSSGPRFYRIRAE